MKYTIAKALILLCLFIPASVFSQAPPEPMCQLSGTILSEGEPLPFATVTLANTTLGAASDLNGQFELGFIPEGEFTVKVQAIGYKPVEKNLVFKRGEKAVLDISLETDVLGLEQVVVTADRNEQKRTTASVIVNTLTPRLLENTQSVSIAEGLNYIPGLRLENNCQNCGFTQVRMNGMDGAHSQVLINNRAIFSNLAGVYGLELIPSSMIERIEVVRGGGSALYGSNAVAGTINLITRDPMNNSYDISTQHSSIGVGTDGKVASDYSLNMNTTIVSDDKKTGFALFGFYRDKDPFDANGDGYSESSKIENLTFGGRLYHRIDYRNKLTLDFIRVNEERRGGNAFDKPHHEADVSEAVDHKITTTALTYERFIGTGSLLSVYGSAQNVDRASYYGANQSLADYGQTDGLTFNVGTQFKSDFGKNSIVTGIELVHDDMLDQKLGYLDLIYDDNGNVIGSNGHVPNTVITDQNKNVYGVFAQYDRYFGPVKASVGARFDRYEITDLDHKEGNNSGNVFSPRLNILWDIAPSLQWRVSYSQGYRAPQVFDEDLHIETSGSRKVVHANAPDLKQETSHSYMTSVDFNRKIGNWNLGLLAEGFYTHLNDAFAQNPEYDETTGVTTYIRTNADNGATVKGVNFEANASPGNRIYLKAGYTIQSSVYGDAQELGEKDFLRTPDDYGFLSLDYDVMPRLCLIASATYTGKMKVAYYGTEFRPDDIIIEEDGIQGTIRTTPTFFDLGFKAEYDLKVAGLPFKAFAGVKNILNSFQDDFDSGMDRDPAYIYGPTNPRTVYFGIKLSNVFGH
ncbi:TonB-dependent receptor [Carboxylicivirga mesophila]|uniref:TonB-dependent receptor n=1 Tax=Carboxylicivirga mesophila TaxID=1166478 RepID=A0ABS5KH88_9BACT|nr:TonB-dependent receptor [Carboxylicivirga mesophila]MBS2213811.1 TonB-dependent receptor [Carboxylicivirga mesophila]